MAGEPRVCPGCGEPMQVFYAKAVELDRCGRCGGIWFDWGELESVTGRVLEPEPLGGETARRCAYCRITMVPAVLPGGIPVETCTACRGLYLDAGELSELGAEEPDRPGEVEAAPDPPRPGGVEAPVVSAPLLSTVESVEPQFALAELKAEEAEAAWRRAESERARSLEPLRAFDSFACVKCGKRFPLKEGQAVRLGLACSACTPQAPLQVPPGKRAQRNWLTAFDFVLDWLEPTLPGRRRRR